MKLFSRPDFGAAAAQAQPVSQVVADLAVFVGRFQIFHTGHLAVVREALRQARYVCILIGSADAPRCHHNPFTFEERSDMIRLSLAAEDRDRVFLLPLEDSVYNDEKWVSRVQGLINEQLRVLQIGHKVFPEDHKPRVALIGHNKDASSYYLKLFPQWESIDVENHKFLSATRMRQAYFSNIVDLWLADCDGHRDGDSPREHLVPTAVRGFLTEFAKSAAYRDIKDEYEFVTRYKAQWASAPYPVTFVTVDACVVQSGHVLLVRRKGRPGKGLLALPGGFLNQDETVEEGMLRELREETKIAVPMPVLKGSIVAQRVFDDPNRSSRGRTITHAFLIHLKPDASLPEIRNKKPQLASVEGADDAEKALWVPLSEVRREQMMEDHKDIIETLVAMI